MLAHQKQALARLQGEQAIDYERFHDEVYAERGTPSGMMGRWAWHIEIDKRFEAFLRANYADEIAMMIDIAPDFISITKQTVEGTSPAD